MNMDYEADTKTITIDGEEFPLDPKVWNLILSISKERDDVQDLLGRACRDSIDTEGNIIDACRPILGSKYIDGDSYCVPPVDDLVDKLVERHDDLKRKLNPFQWNEKERDAWHRNIPDLQRAFHDLLHL